MMMISMAAVTITQQHLVCSIQSRKFKNQLSPIVIPTDLFNSSFAFEVQREYQDQITEKEFAEKQLVSVPEYRYQEVPCEYQDTNGALVRYV